MKTIFLVLVLCLVGCSSKKSRNSSKNAPKPSASGRPSWVNDPMEFCKAAKLCAVGEATGHMMSEAAAREGISKVFQTKVSSSTDVTTSSSSKSDGQGPLSASVEEDTVKSINETTSEVLKGVEILEKWEDPKEGVVFSLAGLNKKNAANRFRNEMKSLDDKIDSFYKSGKRSDLNRILRLFKVREQINKRYEVLADRRYARKISFQKVMNKKRAKAASATTVLVNLKAVNYSRELRNLITQLLIDNDYMVVDKSKGKRDFTLDGSLGHEKITINVEGFEKYRFLLKIRSVNKEGLKVGALSFSNTQMGRHLSQAYEQAFPAIKKYLLDNLNELNMD